MTDSFMHDHQSAVDSFMEDKAIQDLEDAGIYPDPGTDIEVGDLVQTTQEYNSLCTTSGKVIEDFGNKVLIIDDDAETEDNVLEFYKSDLQIIENDNDDYEPTDLEMQQSFGTPWHDWI
tara:strand:- start:387 stop:743 length:357 start_codon:yes stop_codon:yes gene_type:complete